jgi:hypothetical protein
MKTINQIVTVIEGFAALCLGSSGGVVWVNQSDAASFSEGAKVYLPQPCGIEGELELLLAITLREVAKIKHSESGAFADISAHAQRLRYAAGIEDARIKQLISEPFKGAPSIFDAATRVIHQAVTQARANDDVNPDMLKQWAIWAAANDAFLGTPSSALVATEFADNAGECVDAAKLGKAMGVAQASPWLMSSEAAIACAVRIEAMLAEPEREQQPPPQSQPQGGGDSTQSDPQPQDGGEPDKAEQENPAGQGGDQEGQGDQTQTEPQSQQEGDQPQAPPTGEASEQDSTSQGQEAQGGQGQSGNQQSGSSESGAQTGAGGGGDSLSDALAMLKGHKGAEPMRPESIPTGPQQANQVAAELMQAMAQAAQQQDAMAQIAAIADQLPGEASTDVAPAPAAGEDDDVQDAMLALASGDGADSSYAQDDLHDGCHMLDPLPSRLVSVLLRALQDKRPRATGRAESGRHLAVDSLWKLRTMGDTRVFRRKAKRSGVDAAVWLLLDRSTSMEDDIELAASTTSAFALALQRISGVRTAMSLFPGYGAATTQVLRFGQNPTQATKLLKSVTAKGGTPMAGAILAVLPQLLAQPVQKRFIVLETDGKPDRLAETRNAIAIAEAQGVQVIGVGIGPNALIETTFARSVTIEAVEELPGALEALFKKHLATSLLAA